MSFDTIGIWTKSEIDATTHPSQYPIQVGTQYVSLQVNNYSPYYLSLQATATGQPFATIKPWTITPVNFGSVGTIYISVNSTLAKRETGNTSLIEGEQVFVVLSTYQDNSQVTELDPTVAANILNAVINAAIQGSVDAVIQSGQVDANITNSTLDVNSTIQNQTLDVSGSAVSISNNSLNVVTQSGSQVTVANTVDANIANTPKVTIDTAGNTVNIGNTSIDTNSTILNEYVSNNSLVKLFTDTYTISNLTNGSLTVEMGGTGTLGLYDGYVVTVHSTGSYYYDLEPIANGAFYQASTNVFSSVSIDKKTGGQFETFVVTGENAQAFDGVFVNLQNNTGSTIASDTVTFTSYGIKATVQAYAPIDSPLYNQASTGEFDTIYYWNESVVAGSGNLTTTVVDASVGGYIKQVTQTSFTPQEASYTSDLYRGVGGISVQNGGNEIFNGMVGYCASAVVNGTQTYTDPYNPSNVTTNFSSGVANQGVTLVLTDYGSSASGTLQSVGFVIIGQGNAPQVPKTIQ